MKTISARSRRRSVGFTFVEVLISTTVFLMATTAVIAAMIAFMRAHRSYSQTAAFNSSVRLAHERMMQELRSAEMSSALPVPTATEFTFYTYDLNQVRMKVFYFQSGTTGKYALMRKATKNLSQTLSTSLDPATDVAPMEVYSNLESLTFRYYKISNGDVAITPSDASAVKAVSVEIVPAARHKLLMGRDDEGIREKSNLTKVSNAIIHLRNANAS